MVYRAYDYYLSLLMFFLYLSRSKILNDHRTVPKFFFVICVLFSVVNLFRNAREPYLM